jgi:hypothetical protein
LERCWHQRPRPQANGAPDTRRRHLDKGPHPDYRACALQGRRHQGLECADAASASQLRKTKAQIITQIDHLLEECSNSQIAAELNKKGWHSSGNRPFSAEIIRQLCCNYKLPGRAERLRARGLLSARKIAQLIDSKPNLVDYWRERGLLNGVFSAP